MATRDAADREPRAAQRAVPLDRFARVIRATRVEAAIVAKHRTYQILVRAHQRK
jgi:hypothetical protein